jgi:DNA-directed RNA polymerase subunit RPC12/RpoP
METNQSNCQNCKKLFLIHEISGDGPGDRDRQAIKCPNCGYTTWEKTVGYFETEAIEK